MDLFQETALSGSQFKPPALPEVSDYLARVKLETGVSLLRHLSLFGGVSLNQLWTDGHLRLIESGSRYEKEWEDGLFAWLGFFWGVRYGR